MNGMEKTDREKVIKGLCEAAAVLEAHVPKRYWGYSVGAIQDALALLKAQEPRVMTLEEVRLLCKDDIVWYEHKGVFRQPRPRIVEFVFDGHITFTDGGVWSFSADGYGERWRLWTSRPTDAQREATPWMT